MHFKAFHEACVTLDRNAPVRDSITKLWKCHSAMADGSRDYTYELPPASRRTGSNLRSGNLKSIFFYYEFVYCTLYVCMNSCTQAHTFTPQESQTPTSALISWSYIFNDQNSRSKSKILFFSPTLKRDQTPNELECTEVFYSLALSTFLISNTLLENLKTYLG